MIVIILLLIIHIVTHTLAVMTQPYNGNLWSVFEGNLLWWMAFDPVVCIIAESQKAFIKSAVIPVLSAWAAAVTLIMIPWFKFQLASFSPISRDEIKVLEQ